MEAFSGAVLLHRLCGSRVDRGFAFTPSYKHLIIVDEFEFASGSGVHNVTWTMHTMAAIQLPKAARGGSAVLSLNGAQLHATVLEPAGAVPGFIYGVLFNSGLKFYSVFSFLSKAFLPSLD